MTIANMYAYETILLCSSVILAVSSPHVCHCIMFVPTTVSELTDNLLQLSLDGQKLLTSPGQV
jgi:hypothetical protein